MVYVTSVNPVGRRDRETEEMTGIELPIVSRFAFLLGLVATANGLKLVGYLMSVRVYGLGRHQQVVVVPFCGLQRILPSGATLDVFFGEVLWSFAFTNVALDVIVHLIGERIKWKIASSLKTVVKAKVKLTSYGLSISLRKAMKVGMSI